MDRSRRQVLESRRTIVAVAGALVALAWPMAAFAYRPFDGTDADIALPGEFELELGPVHYFNAGGRSFLIAPGGVLNLGLVDRLEAVVDFRNFVALGRDAPRDRLADTDLLAKLVLRRGSLQGEAGPSIAVESGVLFPDSYPGSGFGVQADVIVSWGNRVATIHWNEAVADNRDHRFELFTGAIVELGPGLAVRPVSEVFVDRVFGGATEWSALLGAIWPCRGDLAFDVAGRTARDAGLAVWEIRLGLTWAVTFWSHPAHG